MAAEAFIDPELITLNHTDSCITVLILQIDHVIHQNNLGMPERQGCHSLVLHLVTVGNIFVQSRGPLQPYAVHADVASSSPNLAPDLHVCAELGYPCVFHSSVAVTHL